MIAFVIGILDSVSEDKIIVENQNIGFEILVPGSVVSELPQVGNTVKIYTYTYVREDALQLYGFLTKDSMDMFKLLITVNGIGPKALPLHPHPLGHGSSSSLLCVLRC